MDSKNYPKNNEVTSDISLLNELKEEGFKYIMNKCLKHESDNTGVKYLEQKELFSSYLVIYLSSGNMTVENLKKNDTISKNNLSFLKNLLLSEKIIFEKYFYNDINILTIQAFKNILDILYHFSVNEVLFSLEDSIQIYTYFLEHPICKNIILSSFWKNDDGKKMEKTFLGNIFRTYSHIKEKNYLWGKEKEFTPLFTILIKNYKKELIDWYIDLLEYNKNYSKMAYVIDPNKDTSLSSLDFMNISFEIIMGYYHDSRINFFKTTNDLDCKIFDDDIYNQWKINDSTSNKIDTNLYSIIFAIINKFFNFGLLPVIEKIRKNVRTIQQLNDLINLEENSVRWGNSLTSMKKYYITKLTNKIVKLKLKNKKYTSITDNILFIRYLRFVVNDMSKIITEDSNRLPKNSIEIIGSILDFSKTQLKANMLGDNSSHIVNLSIQILNNNEEKTFIKIKFLNFITVNNHIVSEILINSNNHNIIKYNLKQYMDCLINFYHKIDSNGSNYYNKMTARYKINGVISKYIILYKNLLDKNDTISIFDNTYKWNTSLREIFENSEKWNNLAHLLISDVCFYFEEITSSINKINDLKNSTNFREIVTNEDLIQQQVITMSTYVIYFESNILLIDKFLHNIPLSINNSLNLNKFINCLVFFTYSLIEEKNISILNFDFDYYKIQFKWNLILEIIHTAFCYQWSENEQDSISKVLLSIPQWYNSKLLNNLDTFVNNGKINDIQSFIEKVNKFRDSLTENEFEYPELPSEFCDPIMMTPIEEPILLPESKIFMDKSVISSHLINDETDPFNRTKLTMNELLSYNNLPETILKINSFKDRLENWKKENKLKKS